MDTLIQQVVSHQAFKWVGVGLVFLGLLILLHALVSDADGMPRRMWKRYVIYLERKMKVLFIFTPGDRIAAGQGIGIFVSVVLAILVDLPLWWLPVAVAVVPPLYIEYLRRQRVSEIEKQLDGFILAIANALKATPSIGDAFISVQQLIRPPLQQEVELAVKEMRVGSTLDQALMLMASRIGSRPVDSAISALLIGRQVGGNLPKILDGTAAALREMSRLEAVVRTKTAEGKAQLALLAVFPGVLVLVFDTVKQDYFAPLTRSIGGYMVIAVAFICWICSLVVARKIVNVDV
ncbi:type II secretion system F family protein [Chondromyces apiculatus]|uniref:Flp pilus assembly protein TadB n=1 Tax=Chondromyces apiculatus DSM 436 TaxID=1192034 RepID=A0A017TCG5_9BACT|nr:type II secretion system F family protein [Chondromyces apiculatus]EYF06577.1 Flp pilus assembly protein TadB [Chondromyces apiculatus DSM 436]